MRRSLILAVSAAVLITVGGFASAPIQDPAVYASVLAADVRPQADRDRDAARHTAEVLAFAQVGPDDKIGDMIIGGGFWTRVFAGIVANGSGEVIAWQPAEFVGFQASYAEAIAAADALDDVSGIQSPIGAPELPAGMDLIFTNQNYHDLHLRPFGTDTAEMVNAAVFAALKPGGRYVIIDHYARSGAGLGVADSLHRIDIADVRREVEAAGFVLEAESDVLKNDTDPMTANVFDASIRGHTSQFMLRFRKPA
ncbi:methyltransferase [Brevundimonas sp. NIBR11]|uniref:class I SAM-dependent methyltransferase n=1 Tax=Brevundimonas sp. NIBR11 TaxID=3015999 RepID=UPI0022F03EB1|nr:methyltransferase [Brevundimonas sp. NIBR11]WGM31046.1 hypothetical protein KKHFBJBL_01282 [Brevundimonas sp. NIBR11]